MNNIFTKFLGQKQKTLDLSALQTDLVGWHDTNRVNTLEYYHGNQFENGYPSIMAIANQFFMISPEAIDANGKPAKNANVINVLAHPNQSMDGLTFREALAIMSLVHNKVYIRVWHTGTTITERNITGLSFLEGVHEFQDGQGTVYQTPQGDTFRENEVIELKNVNPYDLTKGYSVANAVRRWADIDDYIAAYQTGFFQNGAVPAGQFIITAPSSQEFNDIVQNMKSKHRGAGKSNNVTYSYSPIDPATGKPAQSSITWVPFNVANKDLALSDIFAQVNKKIDSAYGVPPSIRGDNSNNTWASVRVDQEIFIDNTIRPFATKIWTKFTHELNNITGGLGYTLVVEIETPHIAEEDLAKAQTETANVGNILALVNAGYSLESSVTALCLPDEYMALETVETSQTAPMDPTEDIPEVDEGNEVTDAPDDVAQVKKLDPLMVNCKHCGRYLFKATGTTVVEDMPCPKCKAHLNFKIISELGDDATHTFTYQETEPKDYKSVAQNKELSQEQIALTEKQIATVMRKQMQDQINSVDVKTKAVGDADQAKIDLYAKEIMTIVGPLMTSEGMKQYLLARTIQGIKGEDLSTFKLSEDELTKYQKYLQGIVKGYSEDTAASIRSVLETSIGNKLPISEVKKNLSNIMNTDDYRVTRLALTETNRAGNNGSISAMQQVQKDAKVTINKIWQARPGACEYCRALDGTEVGVSEEFVAKGAIITGADGGERVNDFGHMDVPTAHSNCGCYTTYKVVKE